MSNSEVPLVSRSRKELGRSMPNAPVPMDTTYSRVYAILTTLLEVLIPSKVWMFVDEGPIDFTASHSVVERLTADQWVLLRHMGFLTKTTDPSGSVVTMTFDVRLSNKWSSPHGAPDWASRGTQALWISDQRRNRKTTVYLSEVDKITYTLPSVTLTNEQCGDLLTLRTLGWVHDGTDFTAEGGAVLTYTRNTTLDHSLSGILSRYRCSGSPVRYLHFLGDDRLRIDMLMRGESAVYVSCYHSPEYMEVTKAVKTPLS